MTLEARRRSLLAAASLLGFVACTAGGAAPVTPDLVARARRLDPSASEASLENGRALFSTRCHECHALPEPASRSAEQWPRILARMGTYAKLDDAQKRDVTNYLSAASK